MNKIKNREYFGVELHWRWHGRKLFMNKNWQTWVVKQDNQLTKSNYCIHDEKLQRRHLMQKLSNESTKKECDYTMR